MIFNHFVIYVSTHVMVVPPGCREDGRMRHVFIERLIEDRTDSTFSYYEFLQHLQKETKS